MIKRTFLYAITSLTLLLSISANTVNASTVDVAEGFVRVEQVRNEIERSLFQMGDLGHSKAFNEGFKKVEAERLLKKLSYLEIKTIVDELLAVENPTESDENHLVLTMEIVAKKHLERSYKDSVETLVKESNYSQYAKNKISTFFPLEYGVEVEKPILNQGKPKSRFFWRNLVSFIGWGSIILFLLATFSSFRINKYLPDDFDLDEFVEDDDKEKDSSTNEDEENKEDNENKENKEAKENKED